MFLYNTIKRQVTWAMLIIFHFNIRNIFMDYGFSSAFEENKLYYFTLE